MAKTPEITDKVINNSTVPGASLTQALNNIALTISSSVIYKGIWDANANLPHLTSGGGGGSQGWYYMVGTSGATLIDGCSDWKAGDAIVHNGATWDKWDHTESVHSVNGKTDTVVLNSGDIGAEPAIGAKGTAFNKDFGAGAGQVCQGNDGRLSDARTPVAHAPSHNGGLDPVTPGGIGAEPAIGAKGTAFNRNFGVNALDVCQGNDGRLGDNRTPIIHGLNDDARHSSPVPVGKMFKANAQGLPIEATNTDTEVSTHIASTSNPHATTKSQVGLGNVTDYAQLKRAAGDIDSFGSKLTPANADMLLMEDSSNSMAKVKVSYQNLNRPQASLCWSMGTGSVAQNVTKYIGQGACSLTEDDNQLAIPFSGKAKTLAVNVKTNGAGSITIVTFRKNNVGTALTLTIGSGVTGNFSSTDSIACTIADACTVEFARGAGGGSLSQTCVTVWFEV